MTSGAKTVTMFLTTICGLSLAALGISAHWPAWAWPVLAVLLVAVPFLSIKFGSGRARPVPVQVEEHITRPVDRRSERVAGIVLPSSWNDYNFLFSATIRWYTADAAAREPVINPAGLAVSAVLERARDITEKRDPGEASFVQHELNGVLGRVGRDATGHLQVMAEDVTLTLPEHDKERLEKLAAVRKDKAVWEHQRIHEQSRREYLGDDVLKDTGSAVVWWLARNDEKVDKTVADLGVIAQLTSAANDTDIPERLQHLLPSSGEAEPTAEWDAAEYEKFATATLTDNRVWSAADHYGAFLQKMGLVEGDPRQRLITRQVVHILRTQERTETAEDLERLYDQPDDRTDGPGASSESWTDTNTSEDDDGS